MRGGVMPSRKAEAEWKGNLIQGGGRLAVESGAFEGPYTFKSRVEGVGRNRNPLGSETSVVETEALSVEDFRGASARRGVAPPRRVSQSLRRLTAVVSSVVGRL